MHDWLSVYFYANISERFAYLPCLAGFLWGSANTICKLFKLVTEKVGKKPTCIGGTSRSFSDGCCSNPWVTQ